MLYVSSQISSNKFGVVDTDDNSEEVVNVKELIHYVNDLEIQIHGVSKILNTDIFAIDVYFRK